VDIASLRPEEVLRPEALPEYSNAMQLFQDELTRLNADLFVAEKFIRFPLDLFADLGRQDFFHLVIHNFLQAAVLILTRLTTDQDSDCYTLVRFHNWVVQSLRPEHSEAVFARLREADFSRRTEKVLKKVKDIRNDLIAHLKVSTGEQGHLTPPEHAGVSLTQLKTLRDDVVSQFDALSFGCGYHTWVLQYSPLVTRPHATDARSDVERVLDSVAKDSALFNLPESRPDYWPIARATLGPQAVEGLNAYRRKLGFPDA
jgi:hypothetical protein